MIPNEYHQMAESYQVLSGLPPHRLRRILPLAEEQHFKAGEILFNPGDKSNYLHLIVSGHVALETPTAGQNIRIQTLHPGDAMGWSALTAGRVAHFQARALSPVTTVSFRGEQLREYCDRDPEIGYALMSRLLELVTERLDATRKQLNVVPN